MVADEVPPTDAKKDVHVCWLAVFAFMVVVIMAIVQMTCLIAILVNVAELKAKADSQQQLTQSNVILNCQSQEYKMTVEQFHWSCVPVYQKCHSRTG